MILFHSILFYSYPSLILSRVYLTASWNKRNPYIDQTHMFLSYSSPEDINGAVTLVKNNVKNVLWVFLRAQIFRIRQFIIKEKNV